MVPYFLLGSQEMIYDQYPGLLLNLQEVPQHNIAYCQTVTMF